MNINFEQAFNDTIQSLEGRDFKLAPVTAKAVSDGLAAARQVYLSGQLDGVTTCSHYCSKLARSMHRVLNDPAAPPPVLNGYKIVERILSHHCRVQAQDESPQQRAAIVAQELLARTTHKPQIFREIAGLYAAAYRNLTSIDLFYEDGHPLGRAAAAAKAVAEQFKDQRRIKIVRIILDELRELAREIDRQSAH